MTRRYALPTALLLLNAACARESRESNGASEGGLEGLDESGTSATEGTTTIGDEEGGPSLDLGGGSGETPGEGEGGEVGDCPCQNVLDGIYVLDSNDPPSVWFYDPPANEFTRVGPLGCPAPFGAVANSMAIDREGNAWLNYYANAGGGYEGWLFRAPLSDLGACEMLDYHAQGEWYLMGMGYAVDSPGSSCDTLYLYNSDDYVLYPNVSGGSRLARWGELASERVDVGPTDYAVGELTGTGDARLYAFAAVAQGQSTLVELNKATGAELESRTLNDFDITQAFAFAFWGGDFYIFTEVAPGVQNSKVTRLDYDNTEGGGLTTVNTNSGLHITGAGVSTCASFTPQG